MVNTTNVKPIEMKENKEPTGGKLPERKDVSIGSPTLSRHALD